MVAFWVLMESKIQAMTRIVTINIWQEQGPWRQRLALLARRLGPLAPDVICLQEVRQVPGSVPNTARHLAQLMDLQHVAFAPVQQWGDGMEGLAIISRHPLASQAEAELPTIEGRSRRKCLGVAVDLPGVGPRWIFTTHLAYRLGDGALRERQVLAAVEHLQQHRGDQPAVLCGDFNAVPESDEVRYLRGLTSIDGQRTYLQDAFARCNPGAPGYTWAAENPYTAGLKWLEPDRRLDYIFVTPLHSSGAGKIHACRMVCTEPDTAGVWCSDHFGLLADVDLVAT